MPKELKDITGAVMDRIHRGKIKMRPKVHFVIGSLLMFVGLVASMLTSVFFVGLLRFSIRARGPMAEFHLEHLLSNFPWWIVVVAVLSLVIGIWLLRRYDFSYKVNFKVILVAFIAAILVAGWIIDMTGVNDTLLHRGPMQGMMRRFLQENNSQTQRQEMIHNMGSSVMPFDLDKTLHIFKKTESGGTQSVVVRDAADTQDIAFIRMHLEMEAENFARGDFTDPADLHSADMPGLSVLKVNYPRIKISYREIENGAQIDFETGDTTTTAAIHAWFDAQVGDHGNDASAQ